MTCEKCKGTDMMDSGGVYPWGEHIMISCDCQEESPVVLDRPCPTCRSVGFDPSVLGPDRCSFCDGTEGGHPPDEGEN